MAPIGLRLKSADETHIYGDCAKIAGDWIENSRKQGPQGLPTGDGAHSLHA